MFVHPAEISVGKSVENAGKTAVMPFLSARRDDPGRVRQIGIGGFLVFPETSREPEWMNIAFQEQKRILCRSAKAIGTRFDECLC